MATFWVMVIQVPSDPADNEHHLKRTPNVPSPQWNNNYVPKNQYSSTTRFLFVAGLGGVGHHGWLAILKKGEVCRSAYDAELALKELWFGKDLLADDYAQEVKRILASTKESVGGGLICLNVRLSGGHMFSYPDNNSLKHHPNVYTLALLAEQVGVDLRILVQHRHPAPQLVSLSIHRNFLPLPAQAHQMTNQGALLNAQLDLIDPNFFVCSGFDSVKDLKTVIEEHVIGGMTTVPEHKLSTAIDEHYRGYIDDPDMAWTEIMEQIDSQKLKVKVLEMDAYYSHLKDTICQR